jgi:hypothetical protein
VADWITPEAVGAYIDASPTDERLVSATAAVKAAVERRRSDLDFGDPEFATVNGDVLNGSIRWAGLIFQTRAAPSGYDGYGDQTQLDEALGSQRAEIMRLIGWRRPVIF